MIGQISARCRSSTSFEPASVMEFGFNWSIDATRLSVKRKQVVRSEELATVGIVCFFGCCCCCEQAIDIYATADRWPIQCFSSEWLVSLTAVSVKTWRWNLAGQCMESACGLSCADAIEMESNSTRNVVPYVELSSGSIGKVLQTPVTHEIRSASCFVDSSFNSGRPCLLGGCGKSVDWLFYRRHSRLQRRWLHSDATSFKPVSTDSLTSVPEYLWRCKVPLQRFYGRP